nr:immunoglobulin heavy chain junction region [Mus musculus]MBK4189820.1 immunoglobulin heavy chain junction region [Mus musculus]
CARGLLRYYAMDYW